VINNKLTFENATTIADRIRTFKGSSVIVTKTGETKLPDGFFYVLELL